MLRAAYEVIPLIHLGFGKKLCIRWDSNSGLSNFEAATLPLDPRALTLVRFLTTTISKTKHVRYVFKLKEIKLFSSKMFSLRMLITKSVYRLFLF